MAITITITEKQPVTGLSVTPAAGGSLVAGTTYYYKIVAVEYSGTAISNNLATAFSAWSPEVSFTADASNKSATLAWTPPAKIVGSHYNAYLVLRTTVSGDYSSATAKLLNAASGSSAYATTPYDVSTFTDTGTRTLNQCATYTLGVPKVTMDTTAGSVITEEVLYQAYVSAGKTQFASKTTNQRSAGVQYYFTGNLIVGYAAGSTCILTIQNGRDVVIDGGLDCATQSGVVINMGTSTAAGGATLGLLSAVNDAPMSLKGTLNLYNSKIYDAGYQVGYTGSVGYYSGNAFKGLYAYGPSVVKNCQMFSYNGNATLAGDLTIVNSLLEANPRHEPASNKVPLITDATIYGAQLYTYGAQYVLNKRCKLVHTAYDIYFHGASAIWRRNFVLIDFTSMYNPPKGMSITNPTTAIYYRQWSLNITAVDAANAPLQNVAVSALDKDGATSVFIDSGTKTNTSNIAQAANSVTVLDGTKTPVNSVIRIAAELMRVDSVAGNVLSVTRGYQGSFQNDYPSQHSFTVWLQKDVVLSNAAGVVEEQYLTQETYQGNAAQASPYQYDTVSYTPHVITISKYGYQRTTITQSVAAPIKLTQRMLADAHITATETAAGAYTGIAIDQPSATITLTQAHTLDEVYDYVQWWSSRDANLKYDIPLTTTDGIAYALAYNLVIDGCALTGSGNIAMPSKALTLANGASSTLSITHTGGVYTTISVIGYTVGARLQVYDVTAASELYNDIPAGAAWSMNVNWTSDHTLRLRMARTVGTEADALIQTFGLLSATGASFLLTPTPDVVYNANGIDGDTVLEFTADFPNVQIDIDDPDGSTSPQRGYAWYLSGQMTAPGIAAFHGGMSADDAANYRINVDILDMKVQNTSAQPLVIAGARLYRSDGSSVFAVGTGPIQADPGKAYIAGGVSNAGVAAAVRSELAVELARVDVAVSTRLPTTGYTAPPAGLTAGEVWANPARTLTSGGAGVTLAEIEASAVLAKEASVLTRLPASGYTAPDNAGIAAIKVRTDALPADPASATQVATRLASTDYTEPPAGLSAADVWNHATRTITSGGITVAEIEASSVLAKEATVASRLAAASYVAPLNAAATQAAVDAALVAYDPATGADIAALPTLATIEASAVLAKQVALDAVTAKLPSAGAKMAGEGVTAKNLDQVAVDLSPLTSAVAALPSAAAVRAEMDANSTKLDVSVSSRLAGSSYVIPDNVAVAAIKARTDLIPSVPATQADVLSVPGLVWDEPL